MKKRILYLLPFFCSIGLFSQNNKLDYILTARIQDYNKNKIIDISDFKFKKNQSFIEKSGVTWECNQIKKTNNNYLDVVYTFRLKKGAASSAGVAVNFIFDNWSIENYVIMPSAVYNGNRFEVKKYTYPPLLKKEDYKVDIPITITEVPGLNKYPGKSRLDLNTGDLSTPSIGIYFAKIKKGIWILTEQATELGNSVLTLTENDERTKAEFTISAPCVREYIYSMTKLSESSETGAHWKQGDKATIKCKIFIFDNIYSPSELINYFPAIRKSIGKSNFVHQLPFSKAFDIMENQQNNECWDEQNIYYSLGGEGWNMKWQLGWVGGCMVTYPLSLIGQDISKERSLRNYTKIITTTQAKSGFYYSCSNGKDWCSDCFQNPHPDNLLLIRKNADVLYFFYKYCFAQRFINPKWQMPEEWKKPLRKFSDAFVALWKKYGQFGQFIDIETGEIKIGGTNSAVIAIAGLALASQFEDKPDLLHLAKEAARYYYKNFTILGISCGGPSEVLQHNDSESAFAMLESFIVLYEITLEKEWLKYAEDAAALCATWMVSYDYKFPPASLFGKLDMRTTGAVWANVQNKHGAPAICNLSGDCLLKLYRFTGNKIYLDMIRDLAHNLMQYISREDRPIANQNPGWINERVNLSDWEGKKKVGGIFHGNTWAQVSAMLTVIEIPGIYIDLTKKEMTVFDHVNASFVGNKLTITNPTKFDANIRIFIDSERDKPYQQGFISTCPSVLVKSGSSKIFSVSGNNLKIMR